MFSAEQIVGLGLVPCAVYYMEEPSFDTADSHFFVVLNVDPRHGEVVILACASSQVEKAERRARLRRYPAGALVHTGPADYRPFTKPTVFDCFQPLIKDVADLVELYRRGRLKFITPMPEAVVQQLRVGAAMSPDLPTRLKGLLAGVSLAAETEVRYGEDEF